MFIFEPAKFTCVPEPVKVGQRFAHRKGQLMHVQLAAEHQRNDVRRRLRRNAGSSDFCQPVGMMSGELRDALVQAAKGFAVRGQDQRLWR